MHIGPETEILARFHPDPAEVIVRIRLSRYISARQMPGQTRIKPACWTTRSRCTLAAPASTISLRIPSHRKDRSPQSAYRTLPYSSRRRFSRPASHSSPMIEAMVTPAAPM